MADKENNSQLDYVKDLSRRSPFDIKNHGLKPDPTKDYRWVSAKRIEERKFGDHYQFTKPSDVGFKTADGTVRTKGGMVLMERPKSLADERAKEKELRTRAKTQSAKNFLSNEIERLSSQHGRNLHKLVTQGRDED